MPIQVISTNGNTMTTDIISSRKSSLIADETNLTNIKTLNGKLSLINGNTDYKPNKELENDNIAENGSSTSCHAYENESIDSQFDQLNLDNGNNDNKCPGLESNNDINREQNLLSEIVTDDRIDFKGEGMNVSLSPNNNSGNGVNGHQSMIELLQRTGYTMIQENGQRKYGGPPPGWVGPSPGRGCEIFVGKIPRDLYEDELVPLFETIGPLYEVRLMMDFGGTNRGYAFVMYTLKEHARTAIRRFNDYEIRPGKRLGVCPSVDNCRLFVGNIPRDKTETEVKEQLSSLTQGVTNVIMYSMAEEKDKNRGYAFVEYDCHKSAAMARRKLVPGKVHLWGRAIMVDWAEPEVDVDEEILLHAFPFNFFKKYQSTRRQVKILYVRNLMINTTEESIRKAFVEACGGTDGCIERVKKIKDYAFVHFVKREDALCALEAMNGQELDGSVLEVTLAKPIDQSYYNQYAPKPRVILNGSAPNANSLLGNNLTTNGASANRHSTTNFGPSSITDIITNGLNAVNLNGVNNDGFANGAVSSASNENSFLPMPKLTSIRALRGAGGLRGNPLRLRGYRPQREKKLYEEREKSNAVYGFSKQGDFIYEKNIQVLEDFCRNMGWSAPEYRIENIKKFDSSNKEVEIYMGKVRIAEIGPDFIQSSQMGLTAQEAKLYSADHMLNILKMSFKTNNVGDKKPNGILDVKCFEGDPLIKLQDRVPRGSKMSGYNIQMHYNEAASLSALHNNGSNGSFTPNVTYQPHFNGLYSLDHQIQSPVNHNRNNLINHAHPHHNAANQDLLLNFFKAYNSSMGTPNPTPQMYGLNGYIHHASGYGPNFSNFMLNFPQNSGNFGENIECKRSANGSWHINTPSPLYENNVNDGHTNTFDGTNSMIAPPFLPQQMNGQSFVAPSHHINNGH